MLIMFSISFCCLDICSSIANTSALFSDIRDKISADSSLNIGSCEIDFLKLNSSFSNVLNSSMDLSSLSISSDSAFFSSVNLLTSDSKFFLSLSIDCSNFAFSFSKISYSFTDDSSCFNLPFKET